MNLNIVIVHDAVNANLLDLVIETRLTLRTTVRMKRKKHHCRHQQNPHQLQRPRFPAVHR